MSAAVIHRNREGVLLRYADPGVRRPHHSERKVQPGDGERISVLKAEHALIVLQLIAQYAELSDLAMTRIDDALTEIYQALQLRRKTFGMNTREPHEHGQ